MMGSTEIIVVVAVVLVLFGAKAIPKFAKSLGQAKREFEKGVRSDEESDDPSGSDPQKPEPGTDPKQKGSG